MPGRPWGGPERPAKARKPPGLSDTKAPATLEAVWRSYKAGLTPAEIHRLEVHLKQGGAIYVQLVVS